MSNHDAGAGPPAAMSKSAVDRLGRRLAGVAPAEDGDEELFRRWLRGYEDVRTGTGVVVADRLGVAVSSRLKTRTTLIDKMRRDGLRLSQVQDVAGLRVTVTDRAEQDRLLDLLRALFEGARVVDRRANPSFGYRAVHVIAKVDGLPVEIQIRTTGQHSWAVLVERLADRWGRQIRYGLPPTSGEAPVGVGTRSEAMREVLALADELDAFERLEAQDARTGDILAARRHLDAALHRMTDLLTDQ